MTKKVNLNGFSYVKEYGLLSHCWRHKLLGTELKTIDGKNIEVVDPGLYNRNPGPDYFNAKIYIDHKLFVGNVMVFWGAADWYANNLHKDSRFDNVILVVSQTHNVTIVNSSNQTIPQVVTSAPEYIRHNYQNLLSDKGCSLCRKYVTENVARLTWRAWISALETEWLDGKCTNITRRAIKTSWENVLSEEITPNGSVDKKLTKQFVKDILAAEGIQDVRKAIANFYDTLGIRQNKTIVERFLINSLCPWLFAYAREVNNESICDKAFDFLEVSNVISSKEIKKWESTEFPLNNGGDAAAIHYLSGEYCMKSQCLHCRFGYEYLKHKPENYKERTQRAEPLQLSLCFF